jgi:8-oxo-dGTP pyrophosphatase MutT (NUDIX family)
MTISIKESDPPGKIIVFDNGLEVHCELEYMAAARWVKQEFGLTHNDMRKLFAGYHEDFKQRYP